MKTYTIEFVIEGRTVGSSTVTAMGKTLLTDAAEDEFFAVLRKHEPALLKEAEDEELMALIDGLTPLGEEKLKEAHMKQADGVLDDDLPDDYERWLMELSLDEVKDILK